MKTKKDEAHEKENSVKYSVQPTWSTENPVFRFVLTKQTTDKHLGLRLIEKKEYGGRSLVLVNQILPNTPAHRAGVEPGSLVTMVNSVFVKNLNLDVVGNVLQNTGNKIELTVEILDKSHIVEMDTNLHIPTSPIERGEYQSPISGAKQKANKQAKNHHLSSSTISQSETTAEKTKPTIGVETNAAIKQSPKHPKQGYARKSCPKAWVKSMPVPNLDVKDDQLRPKDAQSRPKTAAKKTQVKKKSQPKSCPKRRAAAKNAKLQRNTPTEATPATKSAPPTCKIDAKKTTVQVCSQEKGNNSAASLKSASEPATTTRSSSTLGSSGRANLPADVTNKRKKESISNERTGSIIGSSSSTAISSKRTRKSPPANSNAHRDFIALISKAPTRSSSSQLSANNKRTLFTLMTQFGFCRPEATEAVHECGDNVNACISHIEEIRFQKQMNQAQIESEAIRNLEKERQKKAEEEQLKNTDDIAVRFPESAFVQSDSKAIGDLIHKLGACDVDNALRDECLKFLTLEEKAVKWFSQPARCYANLVVKTVDKEVSKHAINSCCANPSHPAAACSLIDLMKEEVRKMTENLYAMPENHGGVPVAFLEADGSAQYDIEDDGFEIMASQP